MTGKKDQLKNVPSDVLEARRAPETLERELIFGMAKFYHFYKAMRDIVCPYDPATHRHRQDFSIDRYNILCQAVAAFYQRFEDKSDLRSDFGMPNAVLAAHFDAWSKRNGIDEAIRSKLIEEITQETEYSAALELFALQALSESPAFTDWLERRVTLLTADSIAEQRRLGMLTMAGLEDAVKRLQSATLPVRNDHLVNGSSFVHGTRKVMPYVALDQFPRLTKAIGGGFHWGDSTMIAGINASGKTILMMQLADAFAAAGYRTVVFTTERRPDELFMRCVSNRLSVDLRRLTGTDKQLANVEAEVDYIPDFVWNNPAMKKQMENIFSQYENNLLFVDWSKGENLSIPTNFDSTMEQIEHTGWIPQIVLFDWVGGGLDNIEKRENLRHYYQQAADCLINHGKRHERIMIMAAQLDKTLVTPKKSYVDMSMLSECKTMTNNLTNFIGITALRDSGQLSNGVHSVMLRRQNLCVSKATRGLTGMNVPVDAEFQFQRFVEIVQ